MSKISIFGAGTLLVIAVAVMCLENPESEEIEQMMRRRSYPYLICHFPTSYQKRVSVKQMENQYFWELCKSYATKSGTCAKLCVLKQYSALYRIKNDPKNPIIFDVDAFGKILNIQWDNYLRLRDNKQRIPTIKMKMKACQEKFPDISQLNLSSSCEPWKEVLDCIDGAYGCGRGGELQLTDLSQGGQQWVDAKASFSS